MNIEINFEDFAHLAKQKRPIAVSASIQVDQFTPIAIFSKLYRHFGHGLLTEISNDQARQVLMGFKPRGNFQVKNGVCTAHLAGKNYTFTQDILDALRKFSELAKVESVDDLPGLAGGVAGLISYEAIRLLEKKLTSRNLNHEAQDFLFYCYQVNVFFDTTQHKLTLSVIAEVSDDLACSYQSAINFLQKLLTIIETSIPVKPPLQSRCEREVRGKAGEPIQNISVDISDHEHQLRIQKAKNYIQQGDIFQVTLSRSFTQAYHADPFDLYRTLRRVTAAPYLFYLDDGEHIILGASPEKLVSVQNHQVETVPIAGTCKAEGEHSAHQLLNDEKELAEHMMLVDLARNDLGKICVKGSVTVAELLAPKMAGNLIHLTSLVRGELDKSFDALDALKAVFPAGTVSGAPKFRAMEIIDELETTPRGFYAGAFCLLDKLGNLDSAIVIRTMTLKEGTVTVRAGSGIVFDSVPAKEAEETRAKAMAVLRAVNLGSFEISTILDKKQ